jgi:para-nitrobenzyl esterase
VSSIGFHFRPEDHQTSTAMQKYWTNFAKTGDPNGEGIWEMRDRRNNP